LKKRTPFAESSSSTRAPHDSPAKRSPTSSGATTPHAFLKAKRIVAHLLASIPEDDDSDLAANLRGLFRFAYLKLAEANLRKDPDPATQALKVIRDLAEGWGGLEQKLRTEKSTPENDHLDDVA